MRPRDHAHTLSRIGRSYPRFPLPPQPDQPAQRRRPRAGEITGAIIGILAALGLIGWLLTR